MHATSLSQSLRVDRHAESLIYLNGELDRHDRCKTCITQHRGETKVLIIDNPCYDTVYLLLQHIERSSGFLMLSNNLFHGLWQDFLVHLLVLVQRYMIYLHGHGWHHVWRFLLKYEPVEGLDVYLMVAHHVGSYELASACIVKRLHGNVFNAWKLTYNTLHLLQFDAESAYLHLSVFPAHKLYVAVRQVAHHVARSVAPAPLRLHKSLGSLLRTVKVSPAHLRTVYPQLASSSHGLTVAVFIHHIQVHILHRLAYRYELLHPVHHIRGDIAYTLRRSVAVY